MTWAIEQQTSHLPFVYTQISFDLSPGEEFWGRGAQGTKQRSRKVLIDF